MKVRGLRASWLSGALALLLSMSASAWSKVSVDVVFDDPSGAYGSYYDGLLGNVKAATSTWLSHLDLSSASSSLTVEVGFASLATANGASVTAGFVGNPLGFNVFQQGAAVKLASGEDLNGSSADIRINVGINGYLQDQLWFDPTPTNLLDDQVPVDKVDAQSVLLHELGHAFAFNGWREGENDVFPSNQSVFDTLSTTLPGQPSDQLFFIGAEAEAVYGGPVPLTLGNYRHLGNASGLIGSDLIPDLMNGVMFVTGARYAISALDLAVMRDVGLPAILGSVAVNNPAPVPGSTTLPVPEPAEGLLVVCGLAVIGLWRRWSVGAASH